MFGLIGSRSIKSQRTCVSAGTVFRNSSRRAHDPLRILFCGSDEFSITSLQALNRVRQADPELVASMDVVCRPAKPVQRARKVLREVPIAPVARHLDLPLHQIDTFTKWTPPTPSQGPFNLIVAVSFGLLVPPRILSVARYGGLNVHPSLLPEYITYFIVSEDPTATDGDRFRGPAPLHHTLLRSRTRTGVTLQTLHPTNFDGGIIIEQTPFLGIEHGTETVEELRDLLAPIGAQMLVQALMDGTFVRPVQGFERIKGGPSSTEPSYAHKIGPKDRHIDWSTWTASDILKRQKVIGPLWNITEAQVKNRLGQHKAAKRIIWDQGFSLLEADCHLHPPVGHPIIVGLHAPTQKVCIRTCDGNILVADKVKVEGQNTAEASLAARRTGFAPRTHLHEPVAFYSRLE